MVALRNNADINKICWEMQNECLFYLFILFCPQVLALREDMFFTALGRPISGAKARFTVTPSGELSVRRNSKCK